MSAIADINASAKTNTATAARRRNHCFIADPLLLSIQTFRRPRPAVNGDLLATETIAGWQSRAGSALPGARWRLMPVAALGPPEAAAHGSRHAPGRVAGLEDRQQDGPGPSAEYWDAKVARTQENDRLVDSELRRIGWRVLRPWEFDVVSDPVSAAEHVSAAMTWSGQRLYRAAMTDAPDGLAQASATS